jgi:Glutathione S-transferase, N-terminal domain
MAAMSRPTLYVIPGSHPAIAAQKMLEHKGIDFKRVDLMPVISRGVLKAMRFPGITVPSLRIDGRKITGSREISHALDQVRADPPLFPTDPAERVAVEDAERWGEEVLSDATRRILWSAIKRDRTPLRSYLGDARIGVPHGLAVATAAPIIPHPPGRVARAPAGERGGLRLSARASRPARPAGLRPARRGSRRAAGRRGARGRDRARAGARARTAAR